ncbi:class I SAM-dependent methyltransferase [Geodermatophilus sp. SYSU D00705]
MPVAGASERLAWTAAVVAPTAGQRVLEVGCGHGVLVALLAERGAEVLAVDRSPTMVAAAARRNRAAVDAGRVGLVAALVHDAELGSEPFDVVVSFNVRAFWDAGASRTWEVVDRVLAAEGRVVVAFSVMSAGAEEPVVDAVTRLGAGRGLAVHAVHRGRTAPTESVAVELRR